MIKKYSLKQNGNVKLLHKIRNHFNKPVKITSAYRTSQHNKKVGGASGSYHLKGQASDIQVSGVNPIIVAVVARQYGANGIGVYSNFTHIDTRTKTSYWIG